MRKLILLIFLPIKLFGQNTIGLPDVINYTKQTYSAGLQNWDIKQDKNGIIYLANNEGLLSYDGRNWNLYSLPNKTIVRSVEIGPDNKIYVGGQDELGYFSPAKNGMLQYHSLTAFIPAKFKSFGDVWDIVAFKNSIYFRSPGKIFRFINEAVTAFAAPAEWMYLGVCQNRLYAHDNKNGLMHFENDAWMPININSELPGNDPVTSLLAFGNDSALVTTLKHGLFWLTKSGITKLASANNLIYENERIYAATAINSKWVAIATNNGGVYIIDLAGNIIQRFSRTEGLQNNNVLSIFLDRQSNLWLGLDNGIDLIAYNSAIKQINPFLKDGSGYTALISDNRLYVGTAIGLYSVALQPMQDLSFSKGDFLPVINGQGQTWGLAEINNQLLLGNHEGAFVIKNNTAQSISSNPGFWNFVPLSGIFPTPQMIAGNYKGLVFFDYNNQQFLQSKEGPAFNESSRFIAIDKYDDIWISQPYHGVYRISKTADGNYSTSAFSNKNGLPSALNNHVYKLKNDVVFATEKGVYVYNNKKDQFEPAAFYQQLLGDQSIRYLKEDGSGNIWFIHDKTLGVVDLSGQAPAIIYLPELSHKLVSGFEFIYPVNDNNIFIGGEKGFFHIDFEKYKKTIPNLQVHISNVRIINKTDSLLFGGYFAAVNQPQIQPDKAVPEISHAWKTIRFEFASSLYGYQSNLEYSFRLKGFDAGWSDWIQRTEKEYTNLPAGNYTFEVKVRTNLGKESPVTSYAFVMLPSWYQSMWAYISYALILIVGFYVLYRWLIKKFRAQQAKHEEEQKKTRYIHELELAKSESELVALRNEKLEAEVNYKNSELASSAMHLVKKGELFTKIKGELSHVMKGTENPQAVAELKKMIKTLSEDDNMDKEWENFAKHFDKVHSDFLAVQKEKHPTITPNELKLCAYLRMNLSTKEIAQLMNISVRGVEISRYRLRKKLQIPTEVSLFDYLMNEQKKDV